MVQIVPTKSKRSKGKKKVNMGLLYRKFSFAKSNNTQIPVNKILFLRNQFHGNFVLK